MLGDMSTLFSAPISDVGPSIPISVPSGTSLANAVAKMQDHRIGCLLVTCEQKLVGVLSERDFLLKVIGKDVDIETAMVDDFMSKEPEVLGSHDAVAFAMNRMNLGGYRHVPLVDADGCPVGMVSVKDIVNYVVDSFPEMVLNLPPTPRVFPAVREGA